jgi:hypothetical protein
MVIEVGGDRGAAAATVVLRGRRAALISSTERLDARATSSDTLCLISEATSAFMSTTSAMISLIWSSRAF